MKLRIIVRCPSIVPEPSPNFCRFPSSEPSRKSLSLHVWSPGSDDGADRRLFRATRTSRSLTPRECLEEDCPQPTLRRSVSSTTRRADLETQQMVERHQDELWSEPKRTRSSLRRLR